MCQVKHKNIHKKKFKNLISPFCSNRQLLLCRVALGRSFLQFSAMKMAHSPPGHHSVIGRPSAGGLHFPEYVVYRGEQVIQIFIKQCIELYRIFTLFLLLLKRHIQSIW